MKDLAFGDVTQELANTRRTLERVPDEHLSWRPHAKSMTLRGLATHVTNLLAWSRAILLHDEYDLASSRSRRDDLPSRHALLAEFDERSAELERTLDELTTEQLGGEWTLRSGDHVLFSQPRAAAFRTYGISHIVHHRAQLGVYLRLLDVPVPGLYGPSADEMKG